MLTRRSEDFMLDFAERVHVARALAAAAIVLTAGCASVQPPAEPPVAPAPVPSVATQNAPSPMAPAAPAVAPVVAAPPATALPPAPVAIAPAVPATAPPRPQPPASPAPAKPAANAPASSAPPPATAAATTTPTLDLKSLESRLRETSAIGVLTKLTLKNQVDDLLDQFRKYYQGKLKTSLAELRRSYELLVLKVIALLQDADPPLAKAIATSREAIWGILADPVKFSAV